MKEQQYDVVLCGTGLVQSILASALARAGKTVLHCDAADYYGQLDAVWTFPYLCDLYAKRQQHLSKQQDDDDEQQTTSTDHHPFVSNMESSSVSSNIIPLSTHAEEQRIQFHSMHTQTDFPFHVGTNVVTPYGKGTIESIASDSQSTSPTTKMSIALTQWTLANGKHPKLFCPLSNNNKSNNNKSSTRNNTNGIQTETAFYAQTILQQKSRSLALDITPVAVLAAGTAVDALLTSGVADYLEWKALEGLLYLNPETTTTNLWERVPCNKNDVFAHSSLGPMDKRRLMKFLQLAMDYGTAQQELKEQQEKEEIENTTTLEHVTSLNERHLNQGRSLARPQNKTIQKSDLEALEQCMEMDFATYLAEKQRLSSSLITLIRYALALENQNNHNDSTVGTVQSSLHHLCRHMTSLGRFGTTAFLVPLYGSGELAQAFCRSAAVYGATYMLRQSPLAISLRDGTHVNGIWLSSSEKETENEQPNNSKKQIVCSHVVVPASTLVSSTAHSRYSVFRRISILSGRLIANEQQRHVVIIPRSTSLGNTAPIYAFLLDETVNVTPHVPNGCTLVHITTTVEIDQVKHENHNDMLQKAFEMILLNGRQHSDVEEIFHTSFSYDLCDVDTTLSHIQGLHQVSHVAPGIEIDSAFDQAKTIFEQICPNDEFLVLSKQLEEDIKERIGNVADEEDDEKRVLDSAVGMLTEN